MFKDRFNLERDIIATIGMPRASRESLAIRSFEKRCKKIFPVTTHFTPFFLSCVKFAHAMPIGATIIAARVFPRRNATTSRKECMLMRTTTLAAAWPGKALLPELPQTTGLEIYDLRAASPDLLLSV